MWHGASQVGTCKCCHSRIRVSASAGAVSSSDSINTSLAVRAYDGANTWARDSPMPLAAPVRRAAFLSGNMDPNQRKCVAYI